MPAATTSDNRVLAEHRGKIEGGNRNLLDETSLIHGDAIERCFADVFTVPATSLDDVGDIRRLYKFPAGAYITEFRGTPSDSDTHATPVLVYSVVVVDSADTVKDTLVVSSTNGQAAAGSDRIASAAVGQFVGDRYLAIKIGTAAGTPAAMTYGVFLKYSIGVHSHTAGNKPTMLDVAA